MLVVSNRSHLRRSLMEKARSGDGTEIAFDRLGEGDAVVLVSGASTDHAVHGSLVELLAADLTVLNYDRRGGGEGGDILPYGVERATEDIDAGIPLGGGSAEVERHYHRTV